MQSESKVPSVLINILCNGQINTTWDIFNNFNFKFNIFWLSQERLHKVHKNIHTMLTVANETERATTQPTQL